MKRKMDVERMNARCAALEALGFDVCHEDSWVKVPAGDTTVSVDFSAIDEQHFLTHALAQVHAHGQRQGRNALRAQLNQLLQPEDED